MLRNRDRFFTDGPDAHHWGEGGRGEGQHDVIPDWVAKWGPGKAAGSASCHVGGGGGGLANMMCIRAHAV